MEAEQVAIRTVRPIEDRIAELDEKIIQATDRVKDLTLKKEILVAKKDGRTVMGSKEERSAFFKAFNKHLGFGLTYAQAIAALQKVSASINKDNLEGMQALASAGDDLLAPFMAGGGDVDGDGSEEDEAGSGEAQAGSLEEAE